MEIIGYTYGHILMKSKKFAHTYIRIKRKEMLISHHVSIKKSKRKVILHTDIISLSGFKSTHVHVAL